MYVCGGGGGRGVIKLLKCSGFSQYFYWSVTRSFAPSSPHFSLSPFFVNHAGLQFCILTLSRAALRGSSLSYLIIPIQPGLILDVRISWCAGG